MSVHYYDTLLPAREPGAGLPGMLAGIRLPTGRSRRSASLRAG